MRLSSAQIGDPRRPMDVQVANLYLWARRLQDIHPNDVLVRAAVTTLGWLDDVQGRKDAARNLLPGLKQVTVMMIRKFLESHPEHERPPVDLDRFLGPDAPT